MTLEQLRVIIENMPEGAAKAYLLEQVAKLEQRAQNQ